MKGVEPRAYLQVNEVRIVLLIGSLEPIQRVRRVARTGVNNRVPIGRHVSALVEALQFAQLLRGKGVLTPPRIRRAKKGVRVWTVPFRCGGFFKLADGLRVFPLEKKSCTQSFMARHAGGIQRKQLVGLIGRLIILMSIDPDMGRSVIDRN